MSLGGQLLWILSQVQEFLVGFRLVRYGEVVYRHCSEYYFTDMAETIDRILVAIAVAVVRYTMGL